MSEERIASLEERHQEMSEKLASLEASGQPKKDMWDKLTATTPLVTGLIMSGIGLFFAYTNNQAQLKLQETQTIEKFIPHLTGTEQEKKAAIIAMSSLADTETASKYAELFPSEGTASALQSIVSSRHTKERDKVIATKALASTFNKLGDKYKSTNDGSVNNFVSKVVHCNYL
ncbi:MAG: hypothetical protein SGJ27_08235 [Candidatus Melainabacteria bacterium]|nr:hypothetical protein [Candidatus Melainabacteria bacterium]